MTDERANEPAPAAGQGREAGAAGAGSPVRGLRGSRAFKWIVGTLIGCAALVGLLIGAFQVAVTYVPGYRVELQDWIDARTGLAVEFGALSARLRHYGPELVFHDAVVRTPDGRHVLAAARRGALAFDIWASLGSGRLTAGRFSLDGPTLGVVRTAEGIQLVGQSALPERSSVERFGLEQLPVGQYRVRNAHVTFSDETTGRGPWEISGVSFTLDRRVNATELESVASLPDSLGGTLRLRARTNGRLEALDTLRSTFELSSDDLDLAGWADLVPDEWSVPRTGRGTLHVQGQLVGQTLRTASVAVDFRDVVAQPPRWRIPLPVAEPLRRPPPLPGEEADEDEPSALREQIAGPAPAATLRRARAAPPSGPIDYERIAFELRAERIEDGWEMSLAHVDVSRRDAPPWQATHVAGEWRRTADGAFSAAARVDRLVLDNLWPLLAYLPQSEPLARLRALQGGGSVRDLELQVARPAPQAALEYALTARLDGLRFAPVGRAPGLSGVSGELRATHQGGQFRLDGEAFAFDLPYLFREPLGVQAVSGTFDWAREESGWRIVGEGLALRDEDGTASARLVAMLPADGSTPVLEIDAEGRDIEASAIRKWLPAGLLREKALAWLDDAFVRGRVPHATLVYRGPVKGFPFRHGEGTFLVSGRVEGLVFDYQRGWMPAEQVAGDFEFRNAGMSVRAATGTVAGLEVANGSADIADFKEGRLALQAEGSGDLRHALEYLQGSPLAPVLGEQFAHLRGSGPVSARVELLLPLSKSVQERSVYVHTTFDGAQARLDGLQAPLTALSGTLEVRERGIAAADLHGLWLGGRVTAHVEPPTGEAAPRLVARGTAHAAQLESLVDLPEAVGIGGSAEWQLETRLTGRSEPRLVSLHSDLRGFGIELPAPLGKRPAEPRRLRVEAEFANLERMLTRIAFGEVRALMLLRHDEQGWRLDRGAVRPDGVAAALPDHPGLRIEGTLERLALDDWLALGRGTGEGDARRATRLPDYLRAANLRIGTLELSGYRWSGVRGLLNATPAGWQVNVAGPMAEGELVIPYDLRGPAPLSAKFAHLTLARPESTEEPAQPTKVRDPRNLPAVEATVQALQVGAAQLGKVDLKMARAAQGVRIETLTVSGNAFQGNASGHWLRGPAGDESRLEARLASSDVGATLRSLGYPGFIEAKHGEILADLSWRGGFDPDFLGRASGTLSVAAQDGQVLHLQPGAGRLLGLLSVAALPRRLALDFSDLTDKGLSFDSVHGDFELRDGDAYTRNLLLRGPAAEIGIAGRTGLGTQDYDQTAVVTGNLGASLPVAGALAGGPAVGAALLLFSQMFKEPLKGIARGYYRITGSWENPVVERVDAAEIKEASARQLGQKP